jgi:hypothetical protein
MRNLSLLIIIVTSGFLFSSFSFENENKYTSSRKSVKAILLPQNSASENSIDSLLIVQFFKKHSNLKNLSKKSF